MEALARVLRSRRFYTHGIRRFEFFYGLSTWMTTFEETYKWNIFLNNLSQLLNMNCAATELGER